MAAPMREGAPAGGARPAPHAHPANFEYDDNEWDIGIGDLIIDLDADIEKTDEAGGMAARAEPDAQRTALKMKIKRTKPGTKSSEAKHEIVKSNEMNGEPKPPPPAPAAPPAAAKRGSGGHRRDKARDKHHHPHPPHDVNGVARVPPPPNAPGPPAAQPPAPLSSALAAPATQTKNDSRPSPAPRLESKPSAPAQATPATPVPATPPTPAAAPLVPHAPPPPAKPEPDDSRQQEQLSSQPPAKKLKTEPKETAEVCVGTSVGTITEPDCLGPCEPGTSVTLEGIVWHETEGGVLVVNVTWRGKTYVGTLLDCTRHDWAPPRFCDSPTEELDARTPKGRAKRGRGSAPTDMTNFTETRSSVHSKLRNGGAKGRRALPSPTPFTPPRPDSKRKRTSEAEERPPTPKAKRPPPTPSSPPPDPVLLECPEPNCSKKYKHANGLKYHRSHAHGAPDDDDKDGSSSEQEEPTVEPASPARPPSEPATPATPVKSPTPAKSPESKCDKTPEKSPEKPEVNAESPQQTRFTEEFASTPEPPPAVERPPTPSVPSTPPPEALPTLQPTQFKVKPRSALMPAEERKSTESPPDASPGKRRARRSPTPGVRSPAYSDISDDAAPTDGAADPDPAHRPFPVYHQYYGQPPYLPPTHPPTTAPPPVDKGKEDLSKGDPKAEHKDGKPETGPQKVLPQHFFPYNYVPNFPYNVEPSGAPPGAQLDDKNKEPDRSKTTPSPLDKSKQPRGPDGKENPARPNDNHQILKESIEMKAQMGPYAFQRPPHAREEELRRYYMSLEQRRKEGGSESKPPGPNSGQGNGPPPSAGGPGGPPQVASRPPQHAHKPPSKDKDDKPKEEIKVKQEGQKPTTETQGPPPPPTSQYYLPPYMQAPHYGALPFDPVYRAPLSPMLVGSFGGGWTVPRYHAPEDLSRPGAPAKLELLPPAHAAHHAQYYAPASHAPPHKIHELQEHAKSPQGKPPRPEPPKEPPRSPPPQRHVHTHHHTHVGLGYPLYPPPYPAAAVLASTQAVVNSFPTPPK
ncbi:zinc finger protein 608-like [Achroia grisella]|uniref:zinc finger protein 608-like n=1 Tax=Achroia grisella TaxID=688607 RepID=UPI0027D1EEE8|nr:zinc finger protein 608-like [Achroia grisella]